MVQRDKKESFFSRVDRYIYIDIYMHIYWHSQDCAKLASAGSIYSSNSKNRKEKKKIEANPTKITSLKSRK